MTKFLGVDFGLRRVGLAVSEGQLASPWQILQVRSIQDAVNQISAVAQKEEVEQLVVGVPEGKIGETVKGFINKLKKKGLKVEEADETLSSKKAYQVMIEIGLPREKRRLDDAYSAAEILQNYLDNLVTSHG